MYDNTMCGFCQDFCSPLSQNLAGFDSSPKGRATGGPGKSMQNEKVLRFWERKCLAVRTRLTLPNRLILFQDGMQPQLPGAGQQVAVAAQKRLSDRKSTRLNSSHT